MASVVQLVEASSCNQRVASSIPNQGTYLGCRFDPWAGHVLYLVRALMEGNQLMPLSHINISCYPFFSIPSSLSKSNEKNVLG